MGFFQSIGKIVGVAAPVVGAVTGQPWLSAAGTALGGLASTQDQQDFATNSAATANAFTKEQLQNRHQWEVNDLRAAGLNPILSAMKGAPSIGGSAQAVSNASIAENTAALDNAAANQRNSASAANQQRLNTQKLQAEIDLLKSNAAAQKASAGQSQTAALKNWPILIYLKVNLKISWLPYPLLKQLLVTKKPNKTLGLTAIFGLVQKLSLIPLVTLQVQSAMYSMALNLLQPITKEIKMRELKSAYSRTRVITEIPADTKTKAVQSERDHADINHIVARAYKTGQLPILVNRQPIPELPQAQTYQDMLNKVVFAQQAFERLPSAIRAEFENKPEKLLQALHDMNKSPELTKKLQNLGLIEMPPPEPIS